MNLPPVESFIDGTNGENCPVDMKPRQSFRVAQNGWQCRLGEREKLGEEGAKVAEYFPLDRCVFAGCWAAPREGNLHACVFKLLHPFPATPLPNQNALIRC
jgi:hypothetical protein